MSAIFIDPVDPGLDVRYASFKKTHDDDSLTMIRSPCSLKTLLYDVVDFERVNNQLPQVVNENVYSAHTHTHTERQDCQ